MAHIEKIDSSLGQIEAMPRTVHWIEMPANFKDKDRTELIAHDIWVEPVRIQELLSIPDKNLIIFVNLDYVIFTKSAQQTGDALQNARSLLNKLRQLSILHIVVHTTHLNEQLKQFFKKEGISYLEVNLFNQKVAISSIQKIVNLLYEKMGRARRAHLRIKIPEQASLEVLMTLPNEHLIRGYLRDISMNGICLYINEQEKLDLIPLKGFVKLQFNLSTIQVKIDMGIVARIDRETSETGLYFDLENPKMIKEEFAEHFKALLYQWIRDMLESKIDPDTQPS